VPPDVRMILRLNASNSISARAPPQTPLGSLQRSPNPLAVFKGPTSKGREGKGTGGEKGGEGKGKRREGERRERRKGGEGPVKSVKPSALR